MTRFVFVLVASAAALGSLLLCGCGNSSGYKMATVSGTVTCNGQPVSGGSVTFSPIGDGQEGEPGKAANGMVDAQGKFRLSTYTDNYDGAIVGKHRISFSPDDPYTFACGSPTVQELEVKPGSNEFTIELAPKR